MGKVREWTGAKDQKRASRDANRIAQKSGKEAIKFQREALSEFREDLAPFRELGAEGIGLSSFLTDAGEQANFIKTNPLFQAALESVNAATMNNQAARGKLGSGGTLQALQDNFISTSLPFIDRQTQNINNILSIGQNAAARTGNAGLGVAQNTGGILQNMANVAGASAIRQGDIMAQSRQDLLSNFASGGLLNAATGGAANPLMQMAGAQAMGGGGGAGGFMAMLCDERAKENKVLLYVDDDGIPVYEFSYLGSKERYTGKMAQDIQKVAPDEVREGENGYLYVSDKYAPTLIKEAS